MNYKLMLLDDEPILLEGLARQTDWERCGFELVCTARHGFDGIEKFLDYQPDAILTDIRMRFMSGLDFIRQVRHVDSEVEIAVMSAYDVFEYAQQACALGVTDYLLKPIQEQQLSGVLENMRLRLDRRRSIAQRLEQVGRYAAAQNSAMQAVARKRILLGNRQPETLTYAHLPPLRPGERIRLVMIQNNEEHDAQLLSVPLESMFAERAGERALMHCAFDNGTICTALRSAPGTGPEDAWINAFLDDVRNSTRENLTVTVGCDAESWADVSKSYRSAERQMRLARMLGIVGLAALPAAEESSRYPRELEQRLLELASQSLPGAIEKWSQSFRAWSLDHPERYAFAARGVCMKLLQRLVELDEIDLTAYEQSRVRLEAALALPMEPSLDRLADLMGQLCDSARREGGVASDYFDRIIAQVRAYVSEHLEDSSLNIRAAAEYVHVSAPYLGRLFKRAAGQPFSAFVSDARLERSRRLLGDPSMRVGDVAGAVGFENQSYFQVLFKKKYGVTPGEYRARGVGGGGEPT